MPGPILRRVGRGGVFCFVVAIAFSAMAADVLFPEARHFRRRVSDPVAGDVTTFDEYCAGNQVVTIRGDRVAIADYGKQEVLEIDRAAGTYSITKFDELARASEQLRPRRNSPETVKVEVTKVHQQVILSRAALDVIVGAAYPNPELPEGEAIAAKTRVRGGRFQAATDAQAAETHALPVEQTMTVETGGERITVRNEIVAVTSDRAPQQLLLIPPGATLVESRLVRLARELRELDQLPGQQ